MQTTRSSTRLLSAAIAAALMFATTAAAAQSVAGSRSEERRARAEKAEKGDQQNQGQQKKEYPQATRQQPDAKPSQKTAAKLQKLIDHYNAKDLANARAVADEIIADDKANAYDKALSARIVGELLIESQPAEALGFMQRAVAFDGLDNADQFDVLFMIAQLQMQAKDYAAAEQTLSRLFSESGSQYPEHLVAKGNVLLRQDKNAEAIATLKPVIESTPDPKPEWLQLLMAAYHAAGQGAEAAKLAERVASAAPGDKQSQVNLAVTYLQSEQFDKGAEIYEQLRAKGELTESADYRNLMSAYINLDNNQKVIEVVKEGLDKKILDEEHDVYLALAQAYYFQDEPKIEEAIAAYRKAAPLDSDGQTYLNLARILATEGRLADAKQAAQQALDKGIPKPEEAKSIIARKN